MPKLGLHLQGGFDGDEVVVTVDGREVLRREAVSTRRIVGLAGQAEVEVPEGPWTVVIALPDRGIERRLEIPAGEEVHLGIAVARGEIRTIVRDRPFGYG